MIDTVKSDVFAQAAEINELRNEKERVAALLSEINQRLEAANERIVETMMNMDPPLTKFSAGGQTFYISTRRFVSTKKGSAANLAEWMIDNGHDSLVGVTVHPMTLRSFVGDLLEDGELPDGLKDLVNVFEKPEVRIRNS